MPTEQPKVSSLLPASLCLPVVLGWTRPLQPLHDLHNRSYLTSINRTGFSHRWVVQMRILHFGLCSGRTLLECVLVRPYFDGSVLVVIRLSGIPYGRRGVRTTSDIVLRRVVAAVLHRACVDACRRTCVPASA